MSLFKNISIWLGVILSLTLTVCYLIFSWHIGVLWTTHIGDPTHASQLSIFAITPLNLYSDNPIFLWQILAIVSLLLNWIWAYSRVKSSQGYEKILLPLVCHLLWVMSCVLLHVGGGLASFVPIGSAIG